MGRGEQSKDEIEVAAMIHREHAQLFQRTGLAQDALGKKYWNRGERGAARSFSQAAANEQGLCIARTPGK
jgi:hypothetical protein